MYRKKETCESVCLSSSAEFCAPALRHKCQKHSYEMLLWSEFHITCAGQTQTELNSFCYVNKIMTESMRPL